MLRIDSSTKRDFHTGRGWIKHNADHHYCRCNQPGDNKYKNHGRHYFSQTPDVGHAGHCGRNGEEDEGHNSRKEQIKEYIAEWLEHHGIFFINDSQ